MTQEIFSTPLRKNKKISKQLELTTILCQLLFNSVLTKELASSLLVLSVQKDTDYCPKPSHTVLKIINDK